MHDSLASGHEKVHGDIDASSNNNILFDKNISSHFQCSYYYQNPTTGTVSSQPLPTPQLIKLLVPVREGIPPILPQHTQCLAYYPSDSQRKEGVEQWKPITSVDVLKHAACSQWYITYGDRSTTQGPMSCRGVYDLYTQKSHTLSSSKRTDGGGKVDEDADNNTSTAVLVYSPDICPTWTLLEDLPILQYIMQTLSPPSDSREALSDKIPLTTSTTTAAAAATTTIPIENQSIQDELEAFLSSTAVGAVENGERTTLLANGIDDRRGGDDDDDDDDDHAYESDGGTKYVKDPLSDRWIHEALAPPREEKMEKKNTNVDNSSNNKSSIGLATAVATKNNKNKKNKKVKKSKFTKRNARNWIYVTGLPPTVQESEVHKFFGKVGMLDLDPETLRPKIKLYIDSSTGVAKGDASLCYARPESVALALQVLDESPWDADHTLHVERAHFEAKTSKDIGDEDDANVGEDGAAMTKRKARPNISQAQRKVARLALRQAQDEGFGGRLAGGRKGLRIVVVKGMLDGIPETQWESKIQEYCEELSANNAHSYGGAVGNSNGGNGATGEMVEKITCMTQSKVVLIKFVEPTMAAQAVDAWNGKPNPALASNNDTTTTTTTTNATVTVTGKRDSNKVMEALYWDGVTDYTQSQGDGTNVGDVEAAKAEEEERRHEDFGNWLESQNEEELPPELRLQVAQE